MDVVVRNRRLVVLEIKSSISAGDVLIFQRRVKLYETVTGRVPDRAIMVGPFIDEGPERSTRSSASSSSPGSRRQLSDLTALDSHCLPEGPLDSEYVLTGKPEPPGTKLPATVRSSSSAARPASARAPCSGRSSPNWIRAPPRSRAANASSNTRRANRKCRSSTRSGASAPDRTRSRRPNFYAAWRRAGLAQLPQAAPTAPAPAIGLAWPAHRDMLHLMAAALDEMTVQQLVLENLHWSHASTVDHRDGASRQG